MLPRVSRSPARCLTTMRSTCASGGDWRPRRCAATATRLARFWPIASGPPAIWRSGRLMWRRSTSSCSDLARGSAGSAKAAVTGLRSLLRFLHLQGLIDRDLAVAVPSVARWRLASLVKALDADSVARLLDSCDRSTAVGRRDCAILMLLSRLGLRIGEVAALRPEDLD